MTEEEFRTRVMCHRQLMMAVAMTVLCNRDDALDCLQETFAGLWNYRDHLSEIDNIRQYCFSATRNTALGMIKKRPECDLDSARSVVGEDVSRIETKDDMKILCEGLKTLPEPQRKVVLLSAVTDLTSGEISELTDLSSSNVRVLLSRGRRVLKEFFRRNR